MSALVWALLRLLMEVVKLDDGMKLVGEEEAPEEKVGQLEVTLVCFATVSFNGADHQPAFKLLDS